MKITLCAAILISGVVNLNDGHNGYRRWFAWFAAKKSKIDHSWSSESIKESFCCCLHRIHAAWIEFTVASFRRPKMKWVTIQVITEL